MNQTDSSAAPSNEFEVPLIHRKRVEADGIRVFYSEAGDPNAPVVLLLHGFPASSFQYRELIPRLADRYRVIAPICQASASPKFRQSVAMSTLSTRSQKRLTLLPMRSISKNTRSMYSTTALQRASGSRWLIPNA